MSTERPMPPANLPAYVTGPIERQEPDALEVVRGYVDKLLEAQDLEDDDLASDAEEIVDVEENEGGTIVVEKVPCGKDCGGCPHGPYTDSVSREGDSLNWEYLGSAEGEA